MRIVEKMYRSCLGRVMSKAAELVALIHKPFMVYGIVDPASRKFRKWTRISSSVIISNKRQLSIEDHVWIWHNSILDASADTIRIGEGVQMGSWVGIFTHGSENSVRLLGRQYVHIPKQKRLGYTRGGVTIGAYSFVGPGSIVLAGVSIGKGCLISAMSLVNRDVPDYSYVSGNPAIIKGRTIDIDKWFFRTHDFSDTYYDPEALEEIQKMTQGGGVSPRI